MSDSNRDDRQSDSSPESDPAKTTGTDVDSGTGVGDRDDRGRDPRDESTQIANEERRRKTSVVSLIVALLGAVVALSVVVVDATQPTVWNNVLVGGGVFLAAGYNYVRLTRDVPTSILLTAVIAVGGVWLIIAPAALTMGGWPFWISLASGLLIAGLAAYTVYDAREARSIVADSDPVN